MQRFFGDGVLMLILWVVSRIVLDALMFSALSCILHALVLARYMPLFALGCYLMLSLITKGLLLSLSEWPLAL